MDPVLVFILLFISFALPLYFLRTKRTSNKRVPPGSLGIPVVGQTLSFLYALGQNTAETWLQERIRKYGPVSKLNVFGTPTVFLHGQAANKFIYTCDNTILSNQQPSSIRRIIGERNILELSGHEHKLVRGSLLSFLKPDVLKQYVGKMDEGIRREIETNWRGNEKISVMRFMKKVTFKTMSSLIIGLEEGPKRDELALLFQQIMKGILSVPINLPFTTFNGSLKATAKIRSMLMELICERRAALDQQNASPQQDLLTCLITLQHDNGSPVLSDEEIIDNAVAIMVAGHDTTSVPLTFLVRLLATDACNSPREQEEIAKSKAAGKLLTWDDLGKMKYTWRVVSEILRMTPPILCTYRKVLQDFEYEGFLIPKGWQVMWASNMTHMDDKIFAEASKFDPAHFEKSTPPYSFIAFGGGHRICPGLEFAKIETLITIHNLVTQFNWKLSSPDLSFSRDPLPSFKNGLEILIEPRN